MNALELAEDDSIDATTGKEEEPKQKKVNATSEQVNKIKELYDEENQGRIIAHYKVKSLEELTLQQASEAIKKKAGK